MTDTFQTNIDNIKQDSPEWIGQKVKDELSSLNKEVDMFYEIKNQTVEYKMDVVKTYLESIQNLEWSQLRDKGAAWVMAVQIALESMKDEKGNSKYDVGKVDGFYGSNTKEAVQKFQEDAGFTGEDIDGWAGTKTIKKILETLGGNVTPANNEWKNDKQDEKKENATDDKKEINEEADKEKIEENLSSDEYEGNLPKGFAKTVESHIKQKYSNLLKGNTSDKIETHSDGNNLWLRINVPYELNHENRLTYETSAINLKKCVNKQGDFAENGIKLEIKNNIQKLIQKKKAQIAYFQIKGKEYSQREIFGNTKLNPLQETNINNYFSSFANHNNKLNFNYDNNSCTNYDTSGDNANIRLRINNEGKDSDWNKWETNPDLIFKGSDIINNNYKLDERIFKQKLKKIILNIIGREDYK